MAFRPIIMSNFKAQHHLYTPAINQMTVPERENLINARTRVKDFLDSGASEDLDYSFKSYNIGRTDYNIESLINNVNKYIDITDNGGAIHALDLETFGDLSDNATALERELFGISEVGIVDKIIADGKVSYAQNTLVFGISSKQDKAYKALLDKARDDWGALTNTERSVLERLSRYSGNFDDRFTRINGKYVLNSLAESQGKDLGAITQGYRNMFRLGVTHGQDFYGDFAKTEMENVAKIINNINKEERGIFTTFNGSKFDINVFNRALNQIGSNEKVSISNHLDIRTAIEGAYPGEMIDLQRNLSSVHKNDGKIAREFGRLETFAKAVGEETTSHLAHQDAKFTIDLASKVVDEQSTPLIKDIRRRLFKTINETLGVPASNSSDSKQVIFANKAIKLDGADYIESLDGSIQHYTDWGTKRDHFYNISSYKHISPEQASQITGVKNLNTENGLYVLQLEDAATETFNKNRVTIIRETEEEIKSLFQSNLDVFEFVDDTRKTSSTKHVTQDMINKSTAVAINDSARRKFEGMFQLSGSGFFEAERMYSSYGTLQTISEARLGINRPLSNGEAYELITKGTLNLNGQTLNAADALPLLSDGGKIKTGVAESFLEMYDYLQDTSDVMTPIIDHISSLPINIQGSRQYAQVIKTKALQASYEEVLSNIPNLAENKKVAESVIRSNYYLELGKVSDDIINIDISSQKSAGAGIFRASNINRKTGGTALAIEVEQEQLRNLKGIARELTDRGVLEQDYVDNLFKDAKDPWHISQSIGGKISSIEDKTKLKFNDEPRFRTNIDDFKVNGKSLNQAALDAGLDNSKIKEITRSKASEMLQYKYTGPAGVVIDGKSVRFDDDIRKLLEKYNYSDSNIDLLADGLYNKNHGLVGKEGLSAVLFENPEAKSLHLAFTNQDEVNGVLEDILSGRTPTNAAVANLAVIEEVHGIRIAKVGNAEKGISSSFNIFMDDINKTDIDMPWYSRLRVKNMDTVDESVKALTKTHFIVPEIIRNRDYTKASSYLNNNIMSPILKSSGLSGYENVNGVRTLIPNLADMLIEDMQKGDLLVNFLPAVYETNEHVKASMDKVFGNQFKTASEVMDKWAIDIQNNKLKSTADLSLEQKQWMIINMFEKKLGPNEKDFSVAEAILDLKKGSQHGEEFKVLENYFNSMPTFLVKDEKIGDLWSTKSNAFEYINFGFMNDLSRPVGRQSLAFHNIDMQDISTKVFGNDTVLNNLNSYDIQVGQSIATDKFADRYWGAMKGSHESGIVGNVKIMTSEQVMGALDNFDAESFAMSAGYDIKDVYKTLDEYHAIGSTYQQHIMANPILRQQLWTEPEVQSVKFTKGSEFRWADGFGEGKDIIVDKNKGYSIIGYEKVGDTEKAVRYSGVDGKITNLTGNKISIVPNKAKIDDFKVIIAGVEKGVASVANNDPNRMKLTQDMWNAIFKKETTLIGNFEAMKHESSSLIYGNYFNRIVDRVKGDNTAKEELLELLNRKSATGEGLDMNAKWVADKLVMSGNPKDTKNFHEEINNIINIYSNRYSGIFDDVDSNIRAVINRAQMTEQRSSQGGFDDWDGKGLKINDRVIQVTGIQQGEEVSDFWKESRKGGWEKKIQPIIDLWQEEVQEEFRIDNGVKKLTEYGKAKQDMSNMTAAYMATNGDEVKAKIVEKNLSDLGYLKNGISASELSDTIFAVDEEGNPLADLYKISLGDEKVLNPVTGKLTNEVILPHLNSHFVGDQMMFTSSQKATADFLSTVMRLNEGKLQGRENSIGALRNRVNESYAKMIASYSDEFTNKDGVLREMLLSGRLTHSGQGLAGTIIDPLIKDGQIRNKVFNKDVIKEIDGKAHYFDIAYTSKSMLEDMGVDFEVIGRQLEEEGFRNDDGFIQHLKDNKLIDDNGRPVINHVAPPQYIEPELTPLKRTRLNGEVPQKPEFEKADLQEFNNDVFDRQRPVKPDVTLGEHDPLVPLERNQRPVRPTMNDVKVSLNLSDIPVSERGKALSEAKQAEYDKLIADWSHKIENFDLDEDQRLIDLYRKNQETKLQPHVDLQKALLDYEGARQSYFEDKDLFYHNQRLSNDEIFAQNQGIINENIANHRQKKEAYYSAKEQFFKDIKAHNDIEDIRLLGIYEQNQKLREVADIANAQIAEEYLSNSRKAVQDAYSQIGESWAKQRGFNGMMVRYPAFLETAMRGTNLRLSDSVHGQRIHIHSHTGMALNADIDADNLSVWVNLDKNGRLKSSSDETEKALVEIQQAQARNNAKFFEDAKGEYDKVAGQSFTSAGYQSHLMDTYGVDLKTLDQDAHYLNNPNKRQVGYVSRHGKEAIGYVSTPNYHLRDIAMSQLTKDEEGMKAFKNILELTNKTEQKLIDTKHLKEFQFTQAQRYKTALNMIASGDATGKAQQDGFDILQDVLKKARIFDKTEAANNKAVYEFMPGIRSSLTKVFSSEEAVNQMGSILRKNTAGSPVGQKIKTLEKIIYNTDANMGTEATNAVGRAVKAGKRTNEITVGTDAISESNLLASLSGDGQLPLGIYEYKGIGKGEVSGQSFAVLQDVDSRKEHRVYGNSVDDIEDILNHNTTTISESMAAPQREIMLKAKHDDILNKATTNAYDFDRERVTSEYASRLSTNPNTDKIELANDVLKDYSYIDSAEYRNHLERLSPIETEAYTKANDFFTTPKGEDTRNFLRNMEALKQDNQVTNTQSKSLIEQFNNSIRQNGANRKNIADDLILKTLAPGGNGTSYLQHYNEMAQNITPTAPSRPMANLNDLIKEARGNELYDTKAVGVDLRENAMKYVNQIASSNEAMPGGRDNIIKMIDKKAVENPLNRILRNEASKIDNLNKSYSRIAEANTPEARSFLNWNNVSGTGQEALEQLRSSKIAYGQYVGQEIGNLSMDQLNSVYNLQASEDSGSAIRSAIEGTRERLSQYFNTLDSSRDGQHVFTSKQLKRVPLADVFVENGIKLGDTLDELMHDVAKAPKLNLKTSKLTDTVMDTVQDITKLDGGTIKTVAIGAALGLAGLTLAGAITNPGPLEPRRKPSTGRGQAPRIDGTYDTPPTAPVQDVSIPTARVEDPNGVKFTVKGRGNANPQQVSQTVSDVINGHSGSAMNVNINTTDDSRPVDDNWLSDQFARLLGR